MQAEGRGETDPVTGDQCKNMGPERKSNTKLVSCLQPDRRVEIEVYPVAPTWRSIDSQPKASEDSAPVKLL